MSHSTRKLLPSLTAILCGGTLALNCLVVVNAQAQQSESKPGELNHANPGGTVKLMAKEVEFVKKAGAGNAAEIKLAQLALHNGESQEVKDFANMMVKDHTAANDDLAAVAKNHNIEFPPKETAEQKATYERLSKLKGAAFDKAYMADAVVDHTKDVAEYKEAQGMAKDEKLVAYVNKVEPIVAGHLQHAKDAKAKVGGA